MEGDDSFITEPGNTREAIMQATYLALCEHGYAGLTIQRIGDDFEKSKSLLYHHYDSKDELLLDFLEFVLEEFETSVPETWDGGPDAHLDAFLDGILSDDRTEERREFGQAMAELRAQAANDERYREQFGRHDHFFRERLATILRDGVEAGVFRDVDADRVADYLWTVIVGGLTRSATTEDAKLRAVRAELDEYVEHRLLTGGADE